MRCDQDATSSEHPTHSSIDPATCREQEYSITTAVLPASLSLQRSISLPPTHTTDRINPARPPCPQALVDHLIDNPSDVVGLELGPGDEPLLPGTLLPMRGVRATDNPPPTFSGSSTTGSGGGGGVLDAGGAGSGPDGEAYSGFPAAAEGGAGDASGGAKSESMRRSVAGVGFTVGGGEGSRVVV